MTSQARALADAAANTLALIGMPASPSQSIDSSATLAAIATPSSGTGSTLPEVVTAGPDDDERADLIVLGVLGEGGMGIVQLAKQRSLGRVVAIKRVREGSSERIASLLAEAATAGSLEHPNIVPIHALGRDRDGSPLMVMKKIDGVSFRELLRSPDHPHWQKVHQPTFVLDTVQRLCDAVSFAHSRGVIHRDIKPENVMIGAYGEVYLLDWGVAIRKGQRLPPNAIAGTPAYMAPEMLAPQDGGIDERSDVFLLGATLYEALVGSPPYSGTTIPQVIFAAAICAPKEHGDEVPAELSPILHKCMSRDPDARFQSALELKQALDEVRQHRAAAALAHAAQDKLRELHAVLDAPEAEPSVVHGLFHECRFGFEQALREWPEHQGARQGRVRALERMFGWEIAQKNRAAAAALLSTLGAPAALRDELDALDRRLAAEGDERRRLERLDYDMDLDVGSRQRSIAMRTMAGLLTLGATTIIALSWLGRLRPSPRLMVVSAVIAVAIAGTVAFVRRRAIFTNRINRQLAWTVLGTAVIVILHRVLGLLTGESLTQIASADSFLFAIAFASSALTVRRLYLVPAALFVAGGFACRLIPEASVVPLLVAAMLALAIILASPRALRAPLLETASRKP